MLDEIGATPIHHSVGRGDYHETVAERIATELRDRILRMDYLPGEHLRQADLAAEFTVSQASVRDALRQLELDALVESHPRRGVTVTELSIAEINDVIDILLALESVALRSAAPHLSPETIDQTRAMREQAMAEPDLLERGRLVNEMVAALYAPSHRWRLLAEIRRLRTLALRYQRIHAQSEPLPGESPLTFHDLLDACASGDIDDALRILATMYDAGKRRTIASLIPEGPQVSTR